MSGSGGRHAFILVDDNRVDLMVTSRMLQFGGLAREGVRTYADPLEALAEMKAGAEGAGGPVIVLLDIQMPRMDGFAFLDEVCRWPEEVRGRYRIYMLSSTLDADDRRRVEEHHCALGLLSKPIDLDRLRAALGETEG